MNAASSRAAPISNAAGKMLAISGKVVNDDSQQPVVSVLTVMAEGLEPTKVTTNAKGDFNLMLPVAAEYKVLARAKGFETKEEIISIPNFEEETSSCMMVNSKSRSLTSDGILADLSAPGYQTVVDTFWILSYNRKIVHKDYYLSPIETGLTWQLKNVHLSFE